MRCRTPAQRRGSVKPPVVKFTSRPRRTSFTDRHSAARKPMRRENTSDIPAIQRKNGKMRSVGVQPCQGWCRSGHQVLA